MKQIILNLIFVSFLFSQTLDDAKKILLNNNKTLQVLNENINIARSNEKLSDSWKNPTIVFGANDLRIDDLFNRDLEPMQTHFIAISQTIPLGDSLRLKKQISSKSKIITKMILEDKKLKLLSLLEQKYYKYGILEKRLKLVLESKKNTSLIKSTLNKRSQSLDVSQSDIINSDIMYSKLHIKKNKITLKLSKLKLDISKLLFQKIDKIEISFNYQYLSNINIDNVLNNHPLIKRYKIEIKKSKNDIALENSQKYKEIKLSFGYYQRQNFEDYISFNIAIPLPIYGTEMKRVKRSEYKYQKSIYNIQDIKNTFQNEIDILLLQEKTSLANYKILNNQITKQQRLIGEILDSQNSFKNMSITKNINNLNKIIKYQMQSLDELDTFYMAKTKLAYFKGMNK